MASTMAPEKSRTLHNFSLPSRLSWGSQRLLRCAKVNPNEDCNDQNQNGRSESSRKELLPSDRERKRRSPSLLPPPTPPATAKKSGVNDDSAEAVKQKLLVDLHNGTDKIVEVAVIADSNNKSIDAPPTMAAPEHKPWNLRSRRALCKEIVAANGGGSRNLKIDEGSCGGTLKFSPVRGDVMKSPRVRNGGYGGGESGNGGGNVGEKKAKAEFSVSLSRQEIEDDYWEMIGKRPPRKPKKRRRDVQKDLDNLFPGLWLTEITADMYEVNENHESAKS